MPSNQNAWPPGLSVSVVFDFDVAISEIRKKLSSAFLEEEWPAILVKAAKDCRNELSEIPGLHFSNLFVQITFLDILWERLFGAANGPSPWKMIRRKTKHDTLFGEDDMLIGKVDLDDLCVEAEAGEESLFKALCGGFGWGPRDSKTSISEPELFGHFFNGTVGSKAPESDRTDRSAKRNLDIKAEEATPKRLRIIMKTVARIDRQTNQAAVLVEQHEK